MAKTYTASAIGVAFASNKSLLGLLNAHATRKFSLAGTIVDGPGGVIEFTPTTEAADTAAGNYYYEVKLTVGGSTVTVANEAYTVL